MKTMKLFAAAAILAAACMSSVSCINDEYDLSKVDTEMTLVPGMTLPVEGGMTLSMTGLTKSGDSYIYEKEVTASESGINFGKLSSKVGAYSKHFQVKAEIKNGTDYDMYGTVEIRGGETRVEMDDVIAAKKTSEVVADVYCDGSLKDIEGAIFRIVVVDGDEGLYAEQMPDVQISVKELVLVDGITINVNR